MDRVQGEVRVTSFDNGRMSSVAPSVFVVIIRRQQLITLRYRLRSSFEAAEEPSSGRTEFIGLVHYSQCPFDEIGKRLRNSAYYHSVPRSSVKTHMLKFRVSRSAHGLSTQDEGWWRLAFDQMQIPTTTSVLRMSQRCGLNRNTTCVFGPWAAASIRSSGADVWHPAWRRLITRHGRLCSMKICGGLGWPACDLQTL